MHLFSKSIGTVPPDTALGGDPFMSTVVAVPQYSSAYLMNTVDGLDGTIYTHSLSIVYNNVTGDAGELLVILMMWPQ